MRFRFSEGVQFRGGGEVVHRLDLFVEGKSADKSGFAEGSVGYIKVKYIPSKKWQELYTGDWGFARWLADFAFMGGLKEKERRFNEDEEFVGMEEWIPKNKRRVATAICDKLGVSDTSFEQAIKLAKSRFAVDYRISKRKHVDRPMVEFIEVAEDHRRNGYGTALYRRMALELNRRFGLGLHGSFAQSKEAQATWRHLAAKNLASIAADGRWRFMKTV